MRHSAREGAIPWNGDGAGGRSAPIALLCLAIAVHLWAVFHLRVDTDEPQHLHVVWGWSSGLAPYRDVFDNHAPLLHIMSVPMFSALGERPDIVTWMRLEMLPFYGASLLLAYLISRRLYGAHAALWCTAILAVTPPFLLRTVEFRNDNPWLACWLAALAALTVPSRLRAWHTSLAGLSLGCAAAFSLKSLILLLTLSVAGAFALLLDRVPLSGRHVRLAASAACGMTVVPLVVALVLLHRGVWDDFVRCAIRFNTSYPAPHERRVAGFLQFLAGIPISIVMARVLKLGRAQTPEARRRRFLFLCLASCTVLVFGLWPLVTSRDFAPVFPLASIFIAWLLLEKAPRLAAAGSRDPVMAGVAVVLLSLAVFQGALWRDNTRPERDLLASVLSMTKPSEPVMDVKGETIFRRRPVYAALERITRTAMQQGRMRDTIIRDIVSRGCAVVVNNEKFYSSEVRRFLSSCFVPAGYLLVAGTRLQAAPLRPAGFDICVPGAYRFVNERGAAAGLVDGKSFPGFVYLRPGHHSFASAGPGGVVTVIWAPAVARREPDHPERPS